MQQSFANTFPEPSQFQLVLQTKHILAASPALSTSRHRLGLQREGVRAAVGLREAEGAHGVSWGAGGAGVPKDTFLGFQMGHVKKCSKQRNLCFFSAGKSQGVLVFEVEFEVVFGCWWCVYRYFWCVVWHSFQMCIWIQWFPCVVPCFVMRASTCFWVLWFPSSWFVRGQNPDTLENMQNKTNTQKDYNRIMIPKKYPLYFKGFDPKPSSNQTNSTSNKPRLPTEACRQARQIALLQVLAAVALESLRGRQHLVLRLRKLWQSVSKIPKRSKKFQECHTNVWWFMFGPIPTHRERKPYIWKIRVKLLWPREYCGCPAGHCSRINQNSTNQPAVGIPNLQIHIQPKPTQNPKQNTTTNRNKPTLAHIHPQYPLFPVHQRADGWVHLGHLFDGQTGCGEVQLHAAVVCRHLPEVFRRMSTVVNGCQRPELFSLIQYLCHRKAGVEERNHGAEIANQKPLRSKTSQFFSFLTVFQAYRV